MTPVPASTLLIQDGLVEHFDPETGYTEHVTYTAGKKTGTYKKTFQHLPAESRRVTTEPLVEGQYEDDTPVGTWKFYRLLNDSREYGQRSWNHKTRHYEGNTGRYVEKNTGYVTCVGSSRERSYDVMGRCFRHKHIMEYVRSQSEYDALGNEETRTNFHFHYIQEDWRLGGYARPDYLAQVETFEQGHLSGPRITFNEQGKITNLSYLIQQDGQAVEDREKTKEMKDYLADLRWKTRLNALCTPILLTSSSTLSKVVQLFGFNQMSITDTRAEHWGKLGKQFNIPMAKPLL
jgi:hypothetical protein